LNQQSSEVKRVGPCEKKQVTAISVW